MDEAKQAWISVIIPVYHTPASLLHICLESIAKQSLHGLIECIVVLDGEQEIHFPTNFNSSNRKIETITIKHGGVSAARNAGLAKATGEYITFVDSDDELPVQALSCLYNFAEQNTCDIVQGGYAAIFPSKIEHHGSAGKSRIAIGNDLNAFRRNVLNPESGVSLVWGKLFRRSFLLDHEIRFDTEMEVSEDTAFVFDASQHASTVGFISECVYLYKRNNSSTVSSFRLDYLSRILVAINKMSYRIKNNETYTHVFRDYILFHLLLVQVHYLFNSSAPWNHRQRKRQYMNTLEEDVFKDALKDDFSDFSLSKRISLFALKYHLYYISLLISFVRHKQLHI